MEITVESVNKLRHETGVGMMDCKKALVEAKGDFETAIDILRKKGQKVSVLRVGKEANEGLVIAKTKEDGKLGIVIKLNCETDFVAKNEDFIGFALSIAGTALESLPSTLEELKELKIDGVSIVDKITDQVGKIGEKIELTSFDKLEGEQVIAYNHAGYKIGVLVALNKQADETGKDLAMQIAAMNPVAVDRDDVEKPIIDKELEIAKEQVRAEGKPENMIDKIAEGKLNKFYKESTLLNQAFVKDNSKTVRKAVEEADKDLKVLAFKRIALKR